MSITSTINDAQTFATQLANQAVAALEGSANYINNLGYSSLPTINYTYQYAPPAYVNTATKPDVSMPSLIIPNDALPLISFLNLPTITDNYAYPDAATIDISGLFQDQKPDPNVPGMQNTAPSLDIVSLKAYLDAIAPPNVLSILAPELQPVVIPDIPALNLPDFHYIPLEAAPGLDGDAQAEFKSHYTDQSIAIKNLISEQVTQWLALYAPDAQRNMSLLQAKLNDGMVNGTGINQEYSDSLYRQARSKIMLQQIAVEADLDTQHAKRGFPIPPGSLIGGRNNAVQAAADNLAASATEIYIKRIEQELQFVQFAMQLTSSTESSLYNMAMSYAGIILQGNSQALDYAKTCADLFLQMLKMALERYNILMQKFQIEANVYETLLKSAMATLEVYKLQLDAAKATKEIEGLDVTVYMKRIEAEQQKINQYTSLVDSVLKRAEFERLQLDLYKEQISAYVAQVQAKSIEFGVYETSIKADSAKLQGELSKLEVVNNQLKSIELRAGVEKTKADAIASYNNNLSNQYALQLKAYETKLGANKSVVESDLGIRKLALEAYSTDLSHNVNKYQADIQAARPIMEYELTKISNTTTRDVADANRTLGFIKAQTEVNSILASTSTDLAKAALGAQTTITSDLIAQVTNL